MEIKKALRLIGPLLVEGVLSVRNHSHDRLVEMLHELQTAAEANNLGVGVAVKIKYSIIAAIFDYNPKICDAMKSEHWEKLLQCIAELLGIINARNDVIMGEHISVS